MKAGNKLWPQCARTSVVRLRQPCCNDRRLNSLVESCSDHFIPELGRAQAPLKEEWHVAHTTRGTPEDSVTGAWLACGAALMR